MHKIAFYPGTFDPFTEGHMDLVQRAARLFDQVYVAIAANSAKQPLFSLQERVDLVRRVVSDLPTVEAIGFDYLLIDCMRKHGSRVILRGLRAVSDFEFDFQLVSMNGRLDSDIETVFLTPAENYTFISASLVKEIARLHGDVSQFLHPLVYDALRQKLQQR